MKDKAVEEKLKYLNMGWLEENWEFVLKDAGKRKCSYQRFLEEIIGEEYERRSEKARLARLKRANIPEIFVIETFPFERQPRLDKRKVMQMHDSLSFLHENQQLVLIGPTGCGKTGLGTSFLVHAINRGYRGYFIEFNALMGQFYRSRADHTERKLLKRLGDYDVLCIDELGYHTVEEEPGGLFLELIKMRTKRHATILTSQLGFEEWGTFLPSKYLASGLMDRLTEQCTIFNMKDCVSLRLKNIIHATKK
jgi:DNA replication protein DnaC